MKTDFFCYKKQVNKKYSKSGIPFDESKRVRNFWNNNYIEDESNSDKIRNLPIDQYLKKIKPYLSNIIIGLQNSDTWEIRLKMQLTLFIQKMLKKSV